MTATLIFFYYYINFSYPDSNIINHEDLLAILNLTILVSFDEAYIEYSDKESKFQALESVPECQFGLNGGDLSKVTWFHMSKYVSTMIAQVSNTTLHCGIWLWNGEFSELVLHSLLVWFSFVNVVLGFESNDPNFEVTI